jgi:hypothetical protein
MSKRTVLVLAALLAALLLVAVLSQREDAATTANADSPFIPGLEERINDVSRVRVVKAGDETVATLERSERGWTVAEKGGYPADVGKVRQALIALAQARILEPKTANPELHSRLGVEDVGSDAAAGAELVIEGAGEPIEIVIGSAEGSAFRYARRSADAQSYLIDRDPELPEDTAGWLAPTIIDIAADRIQSVTISHADGETVRILKDAPGQERFTVEAVPEGRELLYVGVADAVAGVLRNLRMEDVAPLTEPLAEPAFRTEFRTFDGLIVAATAAAAEEPWVTLSARYDADQAEQFATQAPEVSSDPATTPGGTGGRDTAAQGSTTGEPAAAEADDTTEAAEVQPQEEASDLDQRLDGWRYRLATYQFEQMSRRLGDLLKAQ